MTGASRERVSRMYDELGDLGDVASALRRSQVLLRQPAPLTVPGVLGRGLHSFTLELNLSNSTTHSWIKLVTRWSRELKLS